MNPIATEESLQIPVIDLLADKRNTTREVHLILFEECNLSCSFCHQDHDSRVGMDTIVSKTIDTLKRLDPHIPYKVNITGGELFHDGVPDDVLDDIFSAVYLVLDKLPQAEVYLGTNLVFNPDRLIELMDCFDAADLGDRVHLTTSYDPAGRFNVGDLQTFLRNVYHPDIRKRITTVNVVITKQNIDAILSNRHKEVLDGLYEAFPLYFDHFIANDSYTLYQPSEERILDFFLYMKEHYPNAGPVAEMLAGGQQELTCQSTIIINKDNTMVTCWGEAGKDHTLDYTEGLRRKARAEEDFLEHYGCLSCEYYQRCTMRCFLHHRSLDERPKECQIKLFYDTLKTA